tara:strand:+ start:450 stop:881 length:432 start_codon:yes stop_codon:yes gene_type:complete
MARPSKLTAEVQSVIVAALEGGNSRASAAAVAGINVSTLQRWMRRGERAEGRTDRKFREFCMAIKKAEATCERRCLDLISSAAEAGRWQAAAWILERRWPESWGRRRAEASPQNEEIVVDLVKPTTIEDFLHLVQIEDERAEG